MSIVKYQSFSLIKKWDSATATRWQGFQRAGYKIFVLKVGMGFVGLPFFFVVSLASLVIGEHSNTEGIAPPLNRVLIMLTMAIAVAWSWAYFAWLGTNSSFKEYLNSIGEADSD